MGAGSGSMTPLGGGDGSTPQNERLHPWALGVWEGPNAATVNAAINLSEEDFNRYKAAAGPILALGEKMSFRMVERNFRQVQSLHAFYEHLFSHVKEKGRIDAREAGFNLMVEVMNWLTATRLFLDHQQTRYSRRFGKESRELARFKDACSAAFDSSFAYRFTAKLRNYAQHCGLPLGGVELLPPLEGQSGVQRIEFYLARDVLLADYDGWGARVRSELEAMPVKFALAPLVEEAMERLSDIARDVLRIDIRVAQRAVPIVREAIERLRAKGVEGGLTCLFEFSDKPGGKLDFSYTRLPEELLTTLEAMQTPAVDPLDLLTTAKLEGPPATDPERQYRDRRGVAVLSAWVSEGGGTSRFFEVVNALIAEDGDIEPVMTGVINIGALSLTMAAAAVGTSTEALLGDMAQASAAEDRGPNEE